MSLFPLLIVLLLMALVAELVVVGPRALRSALRGEGLVVSTASALAVAVLVLVQMALVVVWLVLLRGRPL